MSDPFADFAFQIGDTVEHVLSGLLKNSFSVGVVVCRSLVDDGKARWNYYQIRTLSEDGISRDLEHFSERELMPYRFRD